MRTKTTENNSGASELSWGISSLDDNQNNNHCYMCLKDGQLILCDYCPRSVCLKCVAIPPNSTFSSKVTFLCLLCHENAFRGLEPYYGFYTTLRVVHKPDGKLNPKAFFSYLNSRLEVTGTFSWTAHSQISSERLLILHFVLDKVNHIGSPSHLLAEYLRGFLDPSQLYVENITFDVSNKVLTDGHRQRLQMLCRSHGSSKGRVEIFVSTRSHMQKLAIASDNYTSIKEFFDVILPNDCIEFLSGKNITLWLLSGGAAFRDNNWNTEFNETFERLKLSYFVTFTAEDFTPSHASTFLLRYGQHTLLELISLPKCFEQVLPSEFSLSRQTDIRLGSRSNSDVNHTRYTWTHEEIRPWGHDLPVQCPLCGCIQSWVASKSSGKCVFSCKARRCESRLEYSPPKDLKWLGKSVVGGRWLVIDLASS